MKVPGQTSMRFRPSLVAVILALVIGLALGHRWLWMHEPVPADLPGIESVAPTPEYICEIHRIPMQRETVGVIDYLCATEITERKRLYSSLPHTGLIFVDRGAPCGEIKIPKKLTHQEVYVCQRCVAAAKAREIISFLAPPNKSLDASGGSVFRIMTGPAMLE